MPRTMVLLSLALSAVAAPAAPVRVALLHGSFGNYRHRDDYDGVAKDLGWKLDKVENKDFAQLAGHLGDYDLLLGTALFNYSLNVQNFAQWKAQLLDFVARGGAVVLTDCNYPTHVNWLAGFGADWAVGVHACATTTTPSKWLDNTHPIFSAARPLRNLGATWSHLEPAAGWTVLSRCADDGATALFRTHGRGLLLVTSYWPLDAGKLRNVWATLQYTRAGVLPTLPALDGVTFGSQALVSRYRNLTDQPLTVRETIDLTGPQAGPAPAGQVTLPAGATSELKLAVSLPQRGRYELRRSVAVEGGPTFAGAPVTVVIPPLIELRLREPAYRGVIMEAAPPAEIAVDVTLHPFDEPLAGLAWQARLTRGQWSGDTERVALPGNSFKFALPYRPGGGGNCTLELSLLPAAGGAPRHREQLTIPVIPRQPGQVLIDAARNLRIDGQPCFPIAVYHVPAADFAKVKALGFNTVQAWGSNLKQARENLDAAQANGLKVILEGVTGAVANGNLTALDPALEAFSGHPALLAWYLTDEPSGEEKLAWCSQVFDYLRAKDPHHPVFMTSCSPGEFAAYAPVTDIFAVDPYPIPAQPVTMVSDWMRRAQEAVAGRQPVWLIPQLHNWAAYDGHPEKGRYPSPAEERNMVYQGLVWGSKAIFYYPWDDGSTGLVKDPTLMAAVGRINAELQQLGPELLARPHQVTADGSSPKGLYSAIYRGQGTAYLIAVSAGEAATTFDIPAPDLPDGPAEVLFEGRQASVAKGHLSDRFEPLAVHVYRLP